MTGLFGQDETAAAAPQRYRGRFALVSPEQGIDAPEGLTYRVPDSMENLRVGDRVVVPLGRGNRTVSGYVLALMEETDLEPGKIKPIAAVESETVNLPDDLIDLARWISRYYCAPLGMVFATMLPAAVKHGTGRSQEHLVDLHDPISDDALPSIVKHHKLPPKQRAVLGKAVELAAMGRLPIGQRDLAEMAGSKTSAPVKGLIEKGLLNEVTRSRVKAMRGLTGAPPESTDAEPLTLSGDQQRALEQLSGLLGGFRVGLLHGVTGSGKTEVYIRLLEQAVAAGRGAIVLVPEIALTPQTVSRFLGRFEQVAVLHSGLTAAQRHEQWLMIRDGAARVVVGARSAVFAPVKDLGLIIVDEEHDNSYKQDQIPRYHGRDVAIKRAQMAEATVVLGSATPSLESWWNATRPDGSYKLIDLPSRVLDLPMPRVEIVDLLAERRERSQAGDRRLHLLSRSLEQALRRTFADQGQAMLLLNRRGFANYIACPDQNCGWVMQCDYCDANMVLHREKSLPTGGLVRCHYCGFENRLPAQCPTCRKKPTVFGLGTQRVEEEIGRKFPDARMLRMDSDAMRTGQDYEKSLTAFRSGEVDLLVGTQMIAKGLDFPNVRLVGVISADTALNLPDFRAGERTFQLVAQVAGRSGRSAHGGRVVVQTFTPDHPAIQYAAKHDYPNFAKMEIEHRRGPGLPPITRMARLVLRDERLEKVREQAEATAEQLNRLNVQLGTPARIIGPHPPPIERLAGYFRFQIEILCPTAARLLQLIEAARTAGIVRSDSHMAVDVDPVSLI